MIRTLSPSGAPIGMKNIFHGIKAEVYKKDKIDFFNEQIKTYFGCKDSFLLSSGKAGLRLILNALSGISNRKEIIIPAYSSFCLASAVAVPGLTVKLCDIDPVYFDFDLDHLSRLVNEKTLAVIPVHLFGLVARLDKIAEITNSKGAYLIEDAAQAAGAEYKGKKVGSFGAAGIFSLGRGKSISTVEGGVIVTNTEEIASEIEKEYKMLSKPKFINIALVGLAISLFLNPKLYSIPNSIPFLKLGSNVFDEFFHSKCFSNFQAGLGSSIFNHLDIYNSKRNSNAQFLSAKLSKTNIKSPKITKGSIPSFTRYPLLIDDPKRREIILKNLLNAGLGASKNYPHPLSEIQAFRKYIINIKDDFNTSNRISRTLLTLPTHQYVEKKDLKKMVKILSDNSLNIC